MMRKDPEMDETREDEGIELTDEQLEGVAGGGSVIELPEDVARRTSVIELPEDRS